MSGPATEAATEAGIPVENPATGETIAIVQDLGPADVAAIVARAREAQPIWAAVGFEGRAEVLLAARDWMLANAEQVVSTIVGETGRPADETQFAELAYGLSALEFWAKAAPGYLADEEVQSAWPVMRGRRLIVRYAPLGVIGVIGPWNYPLNNSFGDCIPALAAGNAVVLKPSEVTPMTSLLMARMLAECEHSGGGLSGGDRPGRDGAALVDQVDMVMFTGSVETGKRVMARAAETLTPVSLELGGKDPMIVLADADLERAANAAVSYGMNNSGQVCISVERVYVEEPVYNEFLDRVAGKVAALRQGPPGEPGSVDVGAIIFPPQIELIEAHVRDAVSKGARIVTGGQRAAAATGRFFEPTVLADVDHSMRCMTEETFGPTLPVMKVGDPQEAVRLANDGPYGLQASVWTRDTANGERIARRVEAGVCCVNDAQLNYGALELPMGGWKASGLGSRHGPDGIRKYAKRQSLMITPGYAPPRELHMFPYSAEVTRQVGDAMRLFAASEVFTDAQRSTLLVLCDTLIPSVHRRPKTVSWRGPTGSATHMASGPGPRRTWVSPRRSRWRSRSRRQPRRSSPAWLAARLARRTGNGPRRPARGPRAAHPRLRRLEPRGARRDPHHQRACPVALLRPPRSGHGAKSELGCDRLSGPPAPTPRGAEAALRSPPRGRSGVDDDRGRRLRGRLRRRWRRDRGSPGRGRQAGLRARARRLLQRGRLQPAGGLGLPEPVSAGRADRDGRRPGLDPGGLFARRRHGDQLAELPAHLPLGARAVGTRARPRGPRRRRLRPLPRSGDEADWRDRLLFRAERAPPAAKEGCEALGWDFKLITRNVDPAKHDPELAAYVGFGDVTGSKLSTQKTYLADAHARGADLVVNCRAERILVEGGRAAGVEATYTGPDGATARVVVRAPQVVVACGSLESPALLRRSGIGGPAVGDYLRLHPVGGLLATHDEPQDAWWGPPQSALCHEFAQGPHGHGFLLEGAHHSMGIAAAATPWHSGRQHKQEMARLRNTSLLISLIRDHGHGRVDVDAAGNAVTSYRLADELDVANFRTGLKAVARVQEAAGAQRIVALSRKPLAWSRGEDFDGFLKGPEECSLAPHEHAVFSAHQMGSCRMGQDPATSVADPWGELHDTAGVWIGDASAFPTASGTNPMITIMALALRTSEAIAAA